MSRLDRYLPYILVSIGVLLLTAVIVQVLLTLPDRTLTFLSGRQGGAYWDTAQQYKEYAQELGFTINVVETAGSVDALRMLEEGEGDVAFVQGGVAANGDPEKVEAMATVGYEPVWLFYRRELAEDGVLTSPRSLLGRSIAIGEKGSGTNPLARTLLADYGMTEETSTLLELPTSEAFAQLRNGEIDGAFAVLNVVSPILQEILSDPGIELMNLTDAPALVRRHRYLTELDLPKGTINLVDVSPRENIQLVSTQANLVIRADLHPDLIRLLAYAAVEIHGPGGFFSGRGEFPNTLNADLPISKEGETYLARIKNREFTLDRYLPFWASAMFDRYLLFVVPLLLIVLPMLARSPVLIEVYQRYRINRWYREVRRIEMLVDVMNPAQVEQALADLDGMSEQLVADSAVNIEHMPNLYALRTHIGYVETRLEKRRGVLVPQRSDASQGSKAAPEALS